MIRAPNPQAGPGWRLRDAPSLCQRGGAIRHDHDGDRWVASRLEDGAWSASRYAASGRDGWNLRYGGLRFVRPYLRVGTRGRVDACRCRLSPHDPSDGVPRGEWASCWRRDNAERLCAVDGL